MRLFGMEIKVGNDEQLLQDLTVIFSNYNVLGCHSSDASLRFDIIEDGACSRIVKSATPSFQVTNSKQKLVHFVAIDNCFFSNSDSYHGKRIDCIVFDDSDFCFVELKLNVTSGKTRLQRTQEAIEQLGAIIEFFRMSFRSFSRDFLSLGFNCEAYVVFPTFVYPKDRSGAKNRMVRFALLHGVRLLEDNKKTFQ